MEVISTTVFGIEPGSLNGVESEFSKEAKFAFSADFFVTMKRLVLFTVPKLASFFNIAFMPERTVKYFTGIIRTALEYRRTTGLTRNDFVQQMVTLVDKGFIEFSEKHDPNDDYLHVTEKTVVDSLKIELTDDTMIGHAFVFLLAGFETTSTAITYLCLDLAVNQEAQQKAREEVLAALNKYGELTYDNIRDLSYLEGCMKESLRLHPPVGHLVRNCTKRYAVPGTRLVIEPDTIVAIPSLGVHKNPDIYSRPEEFLPRRWEESHPSCSFLPFGDGPRVCIGMRFATMEIKCCLAKILQNYRFYLHPTVELPIKINPYSFFGGPTKPIMFNIVRIDQ
uniref:Putative cytochrome P450 6a19 n=1 Tax=Lygus hesperus TaxID=30085 RepID=A0A0A9XKJ1_LYGHE